jgi:hypothetical protein
MMWIGIDPGATGAAGLIDHYGAFHSVYDFSADPAVIADAMRIIFAAAGTGHTQAVLEHVHSMPKQGVASSFNFGASFGAIRGILAYAGVPYHLVPPAKWKRDFGLGKDKADALAMARRLFPTAELGRKKDIGRAEALLIAEWGRRTLGR